ncbi:hypothetical protein [uncultured Zhongshania sp.]|uniref:hypothetical protein n=1 Tax=uncultured Zhongshania sp. TaxID=1642288 RepID=UPI0030D769D8
MINTIGRLLEKWAVECRVKTPDGAGLGYPSSSGPVIITEPSRSRMRLDRKDCVRAPVKRASIGGGLSADGKATAPSKAARGGKFLGEVDVVDRFIQTLPEGEIRLLTVFYVNCGQSIDVAARELGVSASTIKARLSELHNAIDAHLRPMSQMAAIRRAARNNLAACG